MPTPSFSNHTTTTEIYTLSLHDALPISVVENGFRTGQCAEGAEQRVLQQAPHQRRMGPPVRIAYHRDQKGADGSGAIFHRATLLAASSPTSEHEDNA